MSETDLRVLLTCSVVQILRERGIRNWESAGVREGLADLVNALSPHLCTLHWTDRLRDVEPKPAGEIEEYVCLHRHGESAVLDGEFTLPELMTVVRDMLVFQDRKSESEDV